MPEKSVPFCGLQELTKLDLRPGTTEEEILNIYREHCRSDHFVLIDAYKQIPDTFIFGALQN